jgi:hypothetical protein
VNVSFGYHLNGACFSKIYNLMQSDILLTQDMADTIIKLCFDVLNFSRLYEQHHPKKKTQIFEYNEAIKKGLNLLMSSKIQKEMNDNIEQFLGLVKNTSSFYTKNPLPLKEKNKFIEALTALENHLITLQKQAKLNR